MKEPCMLLTLTDVSLTLEGAAGVVPVLSGVSFAVGAHETIAITGPSGSGKTSLLMLCAGLLRPTSGQITFDGADITKMDEEGLAAVRRQRIGIVFQNFHLIPTMTALENVAIPLELSGDPDALDKAATALQSVQLGHRLRHYPSQMSGGEQQRVALARALAVRPALILADEPTGNLDEKTGQAVMEVLFEAIGAQGTSLILITHDNDLAATCARQITIHSGRVQA